MSAPKTVGLDPDFSLTRNVCEDKKIDICLNNLKAKYWCDEDRVANACVKNKFLPLDANTAIRLIFSFFKKVESTHKANYALAKYAKRCCEYWKKHQSHLKIRVEEEIKEKTLQLETERAKKSAYALRKATEVKKRSTEAIIDYNTATFTNNAVKKLLSDNENANLSSRRSSIVSISSSSSYGSTAAEDFSTDEKDRLFTENSQVSIATRIKRKAITLHTQYTTSEDDITENERNMMALGLSSILDLSNSSKECQKCIFTNKEWDIIKAYYIDKYSIKVLPLPDGIRVENVWNTAIKIVEERGLFSGMKYISKIQAAPSTNNNFYTSLMIFHHILKTIKDDKLVIDSITQNTNLISEHDVSDLWSPIFKYLSSINNTIRIKMGETVNPNSTINKKSQYPNYKFLTGFKIDIRFILDHRNNEVDLACGEIAVNSEVTEKIIHDESKLARETKDITDTYMSNNFNDNFGWAVQISGMEAFFSTVKLDRNGLYVVIPQFDVKLPYNVSELGQFITSFKNLYTFINNLEVQAINIKDFRQKVDIFEVSSLAGVFEKEKDAQETINSNRQQSLNYKMRPTYYTPPQQDRYISVIPKELFGKDKKRKYTEEEEIILVTSGNDQNKRKVDYLQADEYGWYEQEGVWINEFSGEKLNYSPYE